MTTLLSILVATAFVIVAAVAGMIAFGTSKPPPPLTSVAAPMAAVDYSDLPQMAEFSARDGQRLTYRAYEAAGNRAVILIHGSSGESTTMHAMAKAFRSAGVTAFVPTMRGHGEDGRSGDIDYTGQLDDDLADFVAAIRQARPNGPLSLLGHSAGGGFVIRIAEGAYAKLFDRFVLLAPRRRRSFAPSLRTGRSPSSPASSAWPCSTNWAFMPSRACRFWPSAFRPTRSSS